MLKREYITLEFGSVKLKVNPDKLTPFIREEVADAVGAAAAKYSPMAKYAMHEDEDYEAWAERIGKGLSVEQRLHVDSLARRKGEEVGDWVKRIQTPKGADIFKQGWMVLERVLPLLDVQLSYDDYLKNVPWDMMREFIYQLLCACDYDTEAVVYLGTKRLAEIRKAENDSAASEGSGTGADELLPESAVY